jgi:hypothetical protein
VETSCVQPPESIEGRHEVEPDSVPAGLQEPGCEAVRPQCLVWWQGPDNVQDFRLGKTLAEISQIKV